MHQYNKKFLKRVGSAIGNAIKFDYNTVAESRGRYARMAVPVDLRMPLVSKVEVRDRTQVVEYECLYQICFSCGHACHNNTYIFSICMKGEFHRPLW